MVVGGSPTKHHLSFVSSRSSLALWGCPPCAYSLVGLQLIRIDHDKVPPIVEITDYLGRNNTPGGPGVWDSIELMRVSASAGASGRS